MTIEVADISAEHTPFPPTWQQPNHGDLGALRKAPSEIIDATTEEESLFKH
jgi:hypothetical protein